MDMNRIQWRDGKNQGRLGIDKGGTEAALGRRPQRVRIEYMEGFIVMTDPKDSAWIQRGADDD